MNSQVNYIRQRLSLRKPLAKALELTARLTDKLTLQKPPTDERTFKNYIAEELEAVKSIVPSVKGFDRDFPSLAFFQLSSSAIKTEIVYL